MTEIDKWPRQFAAEILSKSTREERNALLLEVPEEWRELVRRHVADAWERRNATAALEP